MLVGVSGGVWLWLCCSFGCGMVLVLCVVLMLLCLRLVGLCGCVMYFVLMMCSGEL